ncbi:hypothetical protein HanIR_Chr10g0463741 [Helianthus annuus]|nr:hypothetical protein HanIR_Chr10g0463741 [Helianthus annuus]
MPKCQQKRQSCRNFYFPTRGRAQQTRGCGQLMQTVTPQPMAESSGRDTRRIRLLKRIHNN